MTEHANIPAGEIHIVYQWSYANASARTGASGFVAADIGKIARQEDNNSFWVLTATTPTWAEITSTGAVTSFLNLSDVDPSSYSGQAGKLVAVNSTPDGLEFIDAPAGGPTGSGADNNLVRWNGTSNIQDSTIEVGDDGFTIVTVTSALTSVATSIWDFVKRCSSTVAAGFGLRVALILEDASDTEQIASEFIAEWADPTNKDAVFTVAIMGDGSLAEAFVLTANDVAPGVAAGNARGGSSVDLQLERSAATHVPAAYYSGIFAGWDNQIDSAALNAVILGGNQNDCDGYNSAIICGERVWTTLTGELAFGGVGYGTTGDCQGSMVFCIRSIATHTDTTWFDLYVDGSSELPVIPGNALWGVDIRILGLTSGAPQRWDYSIEGVSIINDGGTTTLLSSGTVTANAESDAAYEAQVVADDTNDALKIQVRRNGGSNYSIRWIAHMKITQMRYN